MSEQSDSEILAWIEDFLADMPLVSRRRLGPASPHLAGARSALERGFLEDYGATGNPEAFVKNYMSAVAFKELLDEERPLDDPWVIEQAAKLGQQILRSRDRYLRPDHGDLIDVDLAAAEAIGWFSLLALAKRLWCGEEIENPRAYLRRIIEGDVTKLIDAALRQAYPGTYMFRRRVKKLEKILGQERPGMDRVERRALAVQMAKEELGRTCRFLDRVGEGGFGSIADERANVPEQALNSQIVAVIDSLVADRSRFTDIDRDMWARWKAAGFRGADIDWRGVCSPHVGSQRLQALCRKLRRHLGDWR